MRVYRSLILPLALAAAPAQAVHLCAWLDETSEPAEPEAESASSAADPDIAAAAAAEAAANAVEVAADSMDATDADVPPDPAAEAAQAAADAAEAAAGAADAAADVGAASPEPEPADGGMRNLKLWLEADRDADFYFKMAGEGIAQDDGNRGHSPNSGTYVLEAGKPSSPWGFGMTFYPPGRIDVVIEIRAFPEDIFAEEDPPLITRFAFKRAVPANETTPPATLAAHQCHDITFPPRKDRF